MRGKQGADKIYLFPLRNIPAYAGKTTKIGGLTTGITEHPRVCGENRWHFGIRHTEVGTSPRMRGKPAFRSGSAAALGNIPAYAGKTSTWLPPTLAPPEHPRVCGENRVRTFDIGKGCGTSPRMRGKPPPFGKRPGRSRNIPAYAGKTSGC